MVRVLFIHPDLGIGGAERLVVDAALALQQEGHKVQFITNHHDERHCFEETRNGQLPVLVVGDWLPRSIFGRFYAFCAYFRVMYAAMYASVIYTRRDSLAADVIICDQVSVGIPILKWLTRGRPKIIYYCHFPDQLLSAPGGWLKQLYRRPLNYLEEVTVGMADKVVVNSKFTLRIFRETFRRLDIVPEVLYPSLNTKYFDEMLQRCKDKEEQVKQDGFEFLDINRYERKKNHGLAMFAFRALRELMPLTEWKRCRLIIAGGYDNRVPENVEHYEELMYLRDKLDLKENTELMRSPNDEEKFKLLYRAQCLLYTPENEHFGIVPLEGMYMSKPVIAVNSGGPTETIVDKSTGYLCEKDAGLFAKAMLNLYRDDGLRERMGAMGRMRIQQKFSFEAFSAKLSAIVKELAQGDDKKPTKKDN